MAHILRARVEGGPHDVFISGCYVPVGDNEFVYARTGPFVPPMAFPGINELIVVDQLKCFLEGEPDVSCSFEEMQPVKWVRSVWNGEHTTDSRIEGLGIAESAVSFLDERGVHDPILAASMPRLWLVEPNVELSVEIRPSAEEGDRFVLETTSRDLTRAGELFVIRHGKKFGRYFVIRDELWRRLSIFEIDRWCRRRELIVNLREDN